MSSYSPPTEFTPIFNSYAFQETDNEIEHTHTSNEIKNVIEVNFTNVAGNAGTPTGDNRTDIATVGWDWDETSQPYYYTCIRVEYNSLLLSQGNSSPQDGLANFSDKGTLYICPATLTNVGVDYVVNLTDGAAQAGIFIRDRTTEYDGNVNFNLWNGSLFFEWIVGQQKITIYSLNTSVFVPPLSASYQYNQVNNFSAALTSSGLYATQTGTSTLISAI